MEFDGIDEFSLISVLLAAVLVGFIVHELVHIVLMSDPQTITIRFGDFKNILTVCCIAEGENRFEELAYFVQFIATLARVIFSAPVFIGKKIIS